jgi:hypothetical protein
MKDDHVLVELLPFALSRFEANSRALERCGLIEAGKGKEALAPSFAAKPAKGRDKGYYNDRQGKPGRRDRR